MEKRRIDVRSLFETELERRGIAFSPEPETGRYLVRRDGVELSVSLDNLARELAIDPDAARVARFVDVVDSAWGSFDAPPSADRLYWTLEPNDYEAGESADYRVALSDRVDRVLSFTDEAGSMIAWASSETLRLLGLGEAEAGERAFANLAEALRRAELGVQEIDGLKLGYLGTTLPFKAALILAPNLREVVGPALGWPLLAVAPDRDFLYLWTASRQDFATRAGGVVVEQFARAAHPLSTEVWELSDRGVRAIGAFPVPEGGG